MLIYSNENIYTDSLINIPLWNKAKWGGILFLHTFPPVLSLIFEESNGRKIFEDWIEQCGKNDDRNKIAIRIIKGIDKNHPCWYRVIVGSSNPFNKGAGDKSIVMVPARVHTMQPNDNKNLMMFEQELRKAGLYIFCPCHMQSNGVAPQIYKELSIQKDSASIMICDACDVPDNDILFFSGIMPDDNPIIPDGKDDAPILGIIKAKKNRKK